MTSRILAAAAAAARSSSSSSSSQRYYCYYYRHAAAALASSAASATTNSSSRSVVATTTTSSRRQVSTITTTTTTTATTAAVDSHSNNNNSGIVWYHHRNNRRCFLRREGFASTTTRRVVVNDDDDHDGNTKNHSSCRHHALLSLLPGRYLRDAANHNYDPVTLQRTDIVFDEENGKCIADTGRNDNDKGNDERNKKKYEMDRVSLDVDDDVYRIDWRDGSVTEHDRTWVQEQVHRWKGRRNNTVVQVDGADNADDDDDNDNDDDSNNANNYSGRVLWTGLTEDKVRSSVELSMPFEHVVLSGEEDESVRRAGREDAVRTLYRYGILLVTETPVSDGGAGVAALAAALGGGSVKTDPTVSLVPHYRAGGREWQLPAGTDGPAKTLYGTVWSTTATGQPAGTSVADSAYGHDALPLHTDMTYHRDPPGLQIFTMIQPAETGGQSIFGDGFAAAEMLRSRNPNAFHVLANTVRRYRSVDTVTGWHLEAAGPVLSCDPYTGQVVSVRHNDLDRLPDLPPTLGSNRRDDHDPTEDEEAIRSFYERLSTAHRAWDEILSSDQVRLVVSLRPGDTMVVANQRCFHGRYSFSGNKPRSVMGCYVGQDELDSRFRMQGFVV